jgi:chromosome partitioning protein
LEAAATVADVSQFTYLAAPLRRRDAYANAVDAVLSVPEARPVDRKVVVEMQTLFNALA